MHDLDAIAAPFFSPLSELGEFSPIAAVDLPPDYRTLLAHDHHMTVAVEAFHSGSVDVEVLQAMRLGEMYSRSSLLVRHADGRAVQLGIMRIDMQKLPAAVQREIEGRHAPLGRILIRHDLLRQVELQRLWRVRPGPALVEKLGCTTNETMYGRTARIMVEGRATVELLEIPTAGR